MTTSEAARQGRHPIRSREPGDVPISSAPTAGSAQATLATQIRRLPYPIAAAWQAAESAATVAERLARLRTTVRVVARTLCAFLLPDYLRGEPKELLERALAELESPNGVTWANLLDDLVRELGERRSPAPFAPELNSWWRDDSGKTTGPARELTALLRQPQPQHQPGDEVEAAQELRTRVGQILNGLGPLADCRIVRIRTLVPTRRRTFSGSLQLLVGDDERGDVIDAEWDAFLVPDTLYLLRPDGSALLELSPFIEILATGSGGTDATADGEPEHCYLFDGFTADGRKLIRSHDASGARLERGVIRDGREVELGSWLKRRGQLTLHHDNSDHAGTLRAKPPVRELEIGATVSGRYEIRSLLGSGGMSTVYRVWDRRVEEEQALKVLKASLAEEPALCERFRREAEVMTRVTHPHVARARTVGQLDDGRLYFTMNVYEDGSLADRLAPESHTSHDQETVKRWAVQALSALAYLHEQGIIHRDVKPSNLLVDRKGNVRLADFGIALVDTDSSRLTRTLQRVGSVAYMAPEQARVRDVTNKADVFSLARVLHDLLAGEEAETSPGRGLKGSLGIAIRRMGALDPDDRPAAGEALQLVLAEAGDDDETNVAPVEPVLGAQSVELESLEEGVQELSALCGESPVDMDGVIDRLSRLVNDSSRLVAALQQAAAQSKVDPTVDPLALSVCHVGREIESLLAALPPADAELTALAGLRLQLHDRVMSAANEILRRTVTVPTESPGDAIFEHFDDPGAAPSVDQIDWLAELTSDDELRAHDAAVATVSPGQESFLIDLHAMEDDARERTLEALWMRVDVVLLRGLGRSRVILETAVELTESNELRTRWKHIFALFRRSTESYWDTDLIRHMLAKYTPLQRRVFGRALLFHPWEPYRELALEMVEAPDFWNVISHAQTAVPRLLEIWHHLKAEVSANYLKIFFVCTRDNLLEGGTADRILAVVELMKEFYRVDAFHEDTYFDMLLEMDEPIRQEARKHGLLVDFDADYVRLFRGFIKSGKMHEKSLEGWGVVPLAVQRRLARRGHFKSYFVCHPIDRIALETLPYLLARENVTEFVKMPGINSRLLTELAKEKRLFRRDDARLALVAHPKTPANILMQHIHLLQTHQLRELTRSRDCNQVARSYARRMLQKQG